MAVLTAGTKLTTSLSALVWQPSGMSAADLATLNEAIRNPQTGGFGAAAAVGAFIENGKLFLPGPYQIPSGIPIQAGDYVAVDGAGWPIVIPASIFSTSWQHS